VDLTGFNYLPSSLNHDHEPVLEVVEVDFGICRYPTSPLHFFDKNFHLADGWGTVLCHDEPLDVQIELGFGFTIEPLLAKIFQHHPDHEPGPALADQRESAIEIEQDGTEMPSPDGRIYNFGERWSIILGHQVGWLKWVSTIQTWWMLWEESVSAHLLAFFTSVALFLTSLLFSFVSWIPDSRWIGHIIVLSCASLAILFGLLGMILSRLPKESWWNRSRFVLGFFWVSAVTSFLLMVLIG
jgi:hypothetical protein